MLFAEIVAAYGPLWRQVRRNDLEAMAARARVPSRRPLVVPAGQQHETAARLGAIVQGALTVLPTDKRCLIRSLVTLRMLTHRSIDGRLVIGVLNEGGFGAHAWVEHDNVPVLPAASFQRLVEL
jgi:Transglutaminase-like superfamily